MLTRLRRWRTLIVAALPILLLAGLDAWLKATPDPGYCPEGALLAAAADDFPSFYAALGACDSSEAASSEVRAQISEMSRRIRIETGIRPTPLRWRVWLGNKFLAAYSDDGMGFCVHPGLLLRIVEICRSAVCRS